jgi:hypothetical protein
MPYRSPVRLSSSCICVGIQAAPIEGPFVFVCPQMGVSVALLWRCLGTMLPQRENKLTRQIASQNTNMRRKQINASIVQKSVRRQSKRRAAVAAIVLLLLVAGSTAVAVGVATSGSRSQNGAQPVAVAQSGPDVAYTPYEVRTMNELGAIAAGTSAAANNLPYEVRRMQQLGAAIAAREAAAHYVPYEIRAMQAVGSASR